MTGRDIKAELGLVGDVGATNARFALVGESAAWFGLAPCWLALADVITAKAPAASAPVAAVAMATRTPVRLANLMTGPL